MKYCKSCLYPETAKPTIYFNDDGICSGCTYNLSREDKDVNWKEREELFIRSFLGRMLFGGDEALKSCTVLSGGEKVRCMLSKIMMGKPNVLLIDEPTNHLDLESITAFNNSLINFKGTVLLSTNDRAFAQSVANRIIEITPNGIIDSYLPFNEYITDEKVLSLREKLYK